jgi:hypothetical protein
MKGSSGMRKKLFFVALLVAPVVFMATGASSNGSSVPGENGHKFAGHTKCKSCHKKEEMGKQYLIWQDSKHAKAFETLASDQAKEWATEQGIADPQTDEKCVKCHVTAYGLPVLEQAKTFAKTVNDGVQCESCHGAGYDFKKKKIMADRDKAVSKGLIVPEEKHCLVCHNDESPAWDPARYTTEAGEKVGFDFEQAKEKIAHPVPEGYDPFANDDD